MFKEIKGLTAEAVAEARAKYGENRLEKERTKGFFRRFIENLNDPIIKILIVALIIEIAFTFSNCNYFEVFGIVIAILIATTVSTASEYGSERAFIKMQSESMEGRVRVIRDGIIEEIPTSDVVVGDVVFLTAGERIAADGILIDGKVGVDQSALNGESREVEKCSAKEKTDWELNAKNRVFRGTLVTLGEAVMRVGRVGMSTYYGMVAKDVQAPTRESPLKHRLSHLASQISKIGYVMAIIVAITYLFCAIVVENNFDGARILLSLKDAKSVFGMLIHALTLMITVIVVAVPEGLPMMITVVLSANMKKMLSDGVLVKKLVGIETAGSMNILFTDKTGTITVGEPKCEKIICADATYKSLSALKKCRELYENMALSARYNTDAYLSRGKALGGNGTDRAIYEYFKDGSLLNVKIVNKESFTSDKKYSSVKLDNGRAYIKGAPEIILSRSKFALNSSGVIIPINKSELEQKLSEAASLGNRVVAVAYSDGERDGYIFLGLIVLKDMLRRDAKEAVRSIQRAGVRIVMLTGDGRETATAIAEECGIITNRDRDLVLTSTELSMMSDDEVKKIIPNISVLARALPQDKTRLVKLAQELDLVVGMTGDGINDAPSLKLSDVGFAMGSGAEIAKAAGDVVITNNSLYSINRTILYGRTIFKSIRKFITFQLIMNFVACGISVFGQLIGIESPITIIQMLWVNIIMDTLGGLAFAGEAPLEHYMKEKPKKRDEAILTGKMVGQIFAAGLYTLTLCMLFLTHRGVRSLFSGANGELRFLTAFYALFIFLGIFNCFSARSERLWIFSNISKNKLFVSIMLLISAIQIIMIYCGGELFRTTPLTLRELWWVIGIAFSLIPFDIFRRIFVRLK